MSDNNLKISLQSKKEDELPVFEFSSYYYLKHFFLFFHIYKYTNLCMMNVCGGSLSGYHNKMLFLFFFFFGETIQL